jgi:hypothetical protein
MYLVNLEMSDFFYRKCDMYIYFGTEGVDAFEVCDYCDSGMPLPASGVTCQCPLLQVQGLLFSLFVLQWIYI